MGRQGTAWTTPFLAELERGSSVMAACRAVGVVPATAYEHRDRHPDFAAAWDAARMAASPADVPPGPDGSRSIPLLRRDGTVVAYAIVDGEDFEALSGWKWHMDASGYARRSTSIGSRSDGTRRVIAIRMHRVLAGLEPNDPRQVDHVNGDRLDNRRANLRIVPSWWAQAQNRPSDKGSTSRYRGVSLHKRTGKWQAQVMIAGKVTYLGLFADEDEAGATAEAFRREHMPYATER